MAETTKRSNRAKVTASGVRVRVAKDGETKEQQKAWQDKLALRGFPSIIFRSQAQMDIAFYGMQENYKRQRERERILAQYYAGELVHRPKPHTAISA